MTTALDRQPIVAALNAFTPVDISVYASLTPAARNRHEFDLARRLAIAAELSQPGAARLVMQTLDDYSDPNPVVTLDALIEFGRLPNQLLARQREMAGQSQIRDEILHFDRIMDLDALRDGRDLKHRRDQVWDTGPQAALERLLTLTYERRVLRDDEQPEWLHIGQTEPGTIRTTPLGALLLRKTSPELVAVAAGPQATACLRRLADYCGKHPLGVALGLLDYEMAMNGEPQCTLIAATSTIWFDRRTIKVWACGDAFAFTAKRNGHQHVATQVVSMSGAPLGSAIPAFSRAELHGEQDSRIVIGLGDHQFDAEVLSGELSRANGKGRVYLHDNLTRVFGAGGFAKLTPQHHDGLRHDDRPAIDDYLITRLNSHDGPCTISLEIGHVHADRELGPIQQHGIDLGISVLEAISKANLTRQAGNHIVTEIVPMIDDDHVVNRLSYQRFQQVLLDKGVPADEIVLESSPLILDIACDLITAAIHGEGDGYSTQRHGRNLYLESGQHRIELLEDAEDEMRVGCIVFDTALTIYRTARNDMQALFAERTGHAGDIHQGMLDSYDSEPDPQRRQQIRRDLDRLWKRPLAALSATTATPYLDAYRASGELNRLAGRKVIILNVLEDYYEPLELKVTQFARLLGIELELDCLLFSPYGSGLRSLHA